IIGDEHVDFEFGTGVLKVTPAHDKADFDIGTRHKLPLIEVINADGTMNTLAGGPLAGLDRFKARKVAVEILTEQGVMIEAKPYENNVGFSQRADVPIEPRLSEQWFLEYPCVEASKSCVAEGRMKFHPDRWAKVYDHWLTNIQHWCISRQLWWGHRIPVWTKLATADQLPKQVVEDWRKLGSWYAVSKSGENSRDEIFWDMSGFADDTKFPELVDLTKSVPVRALTDSATAAAELARMGFTQDPDVLDTWFSSWLWPFATMGWPEQTDTLKKFYPTTDLVTGPDIIFFWVARMIMAGYEFMGEAESAGPKKFALPDAMPFQNVYFTGIIRDKQGRKMSKSLGNSPDPLDLIAKFGADALRFGVMRAAPLGQDILFDEQNVELGRNFCNKLWNACRFRQMVGQSAAGILPADQTSEAGQNFRQDAGSTFEVQGEIEPTLLSSDDKWILLKLDAAIREVTIALNEYKFSDATAALYRFFWSEYCDWYVEASKAVLSSRSRGDETQTEGTDQRLLTSSPTKEDEARKANTLAVIDFVLSHTVRMFHPFLPFITEELWHGMGYSTDMPENQGGKTIMFAPWPKPLDEDFKGHYGLDDCYLHIAGAKYELVSQGRNLRREANISTGKKIKYVLKPVNFLPPHDIEVIRLLLNAEAVEVNENYQAAKGTLTARTELGELYLPLEGLRTPEELAAEKARVTKELEKIEAEISKVEQKLANPKFTEKVPPAVLQEHSQRLAEWLAKRDHAKAALDALS
ncbi:MAG: class I tRNA ligase family protein, partial [Verrucomicrobiota bacterium]